MTTAVEKSRATNAMTRTLLMSRGIRAASLIAFRASASFIVFLLWGEWEWETKLNE
jgi:hypothetical protein